MKGGLRFTLDDVDYLTGDDGRRALAEVDGLALTDASRISDIASARAGFGYRAAVLVETTLLRRRAAAKFTDASTWLFTPRRWNRRRPVRWPHTAPNAWQVCPFTT